MVATSQIESLNRRSAEQVRKHWQGARNCVGAALIPSGNGAIKALEPGVYLQFFNIPYIPFDTQSFHADAF